MGTPGYRDHPVADWDRDAPTDWDEAEEFLRQYHAENPGVGDVTARLAEVRAEIAATGTYEHTLDEVTYGAKLAWRNASRCIGRLYWRSLHVLDRRSATTPHEIYAGLVRHLEIASGTDVRPGSRAVRRGAVRPVLSVFAPAKPGRPFARVWNDQLIRYAGYRMPDGATLGDPAQVDFTESMELLGWKGQKTPFDVLPLLVETPEHGMHMYDLPQNVVLEVPLTHPEFGWFAELGLRWYAVPAIANQRLRIGGVDYPLAPFNGWYMGTEIGARNLADADRYNLLPVVADRLGLDTSSETTLWRDRALVELNRAVLHSYERAGVKITDHHTEAARFLEHIRREQRAGREVPADWSWIVPPMSGAATPVFHRYYHEADQRPNFYLDEEARLLARYGHFRASMPLRS
ncbi:nitric oxide synthase oxygenase [Catenuloplanes atrovinosus]|uniref:Nitric oxide synthase oxygenase n=1 Tax=Catenuloplanes atrovinosus TaxID=137266 RepID=A0AAE3YP93_9ACTN|nr:nitric oxide synthase oxygenase [Catenuloplanes atrovinosus]MDR7276137.1 nitric-oxide synthase [Catenuloplanes atrovinosus]